MFQLQNTCKRASGKSEAIIQSAPWVRKGKSPGTGSAAVRRHSLRSIVVQRKRLPSRFQAPDEPSAEFGTRLAYMKGNYTKEVPVRMNRPTLLAATVTLLALAGNASAQQAAETNTQPTTAAGHVTQVSHVTEVPVEKEAPKVEGHPLTSVVVTQCNLIVAVYMTMPDGRLLRFDKSGAVPSDQLMTMAYSATRSERVEVSCNDTGAAGYEKHEPV